MMDWWFALPIVGQLLLLIGVGIFGGALANDAIYRYAYYRQRPVSPWMAPDAEAPKRHWSDRIPVWGWMGLSRESSLHGRGFWIRPLLIEVGLAIALVAYYFYAVRGGGWLSGATPADPKWLAINGGMLMRAYSMHAVLWILLTAATFIDFDERTIPDAIVVPGIVIGVVGSSLSVHVLTPASLGNMALPTTFDSPWYTVWPNPQSFWMRRGGLMVAIGVWVVGGFALCDRRLTWRLIQRVGLFTAAALSWGRLRHSVYTRRAAMGSGAMIVWTIAMYALGGQWWYGCLSSILGLAIGGGVMWLIRVVASTAMSQTAMGFGDVTLMAMVGAMIGWQASLIAIFLAPFTSILIVSVRWLITGEGETPFGPYLAAGTVLTLVFWDAVYAQRFAIQLELLGVFLLYLGIVLFVAMFAMLWAWRRVRAMAAGESDR